jgi:hypothetical protein
VSHKGLNRHLQPLPGLHSRMLCEVQRQVISSNLEVWCRTLEIHARARADCVVGWGGGGSGDCKDVREEGAIGSFFPPRSYFGPASEAEAHQHRRQVSDFNFFFFGRAFVSYGLK